MTLEKAKEILIHHSAWIRGDNIGVTDPIILRKAIDKAIEVLEDMPDIDMGKYNGFHLVDPSTGICRIWMSGEWIECNSSNTNNSGKPNY